MNTIIRHTEYLISRYDCVIIPGLGAILAQYIPATRDVATGNMLPPKRVFTFNSAITDNDGLLATSIARSAGVTVQRAMRIVQSEVEIIKRELLEHRFFTIGRVGTLFSNKAGTSVTFTPSSELVSVSTMWLTEIPTTHIEENDNVRVLDAPVKKYKSNLFFEIGRVAAIVALVVGAWFVISSPFTFDDAMKASLLPEWFYTTDNSSNNISRDTQALSEKETAEQLITPTADTTINESKIEVTETSADEESQGKEILQDNVDFEYYVIVAVLATADEAQKFIEMYPSHNLNVVMHGKQFRVFVSAHHTSDEASAGCLEARNSFPNAWISKK